MADISAHPSSFTRVSPERDAPKRGALRRALDALIAAQQRKADREVAAILAWYGEGAAAEPRRRSDDALPARDAIRSRA